MAKYGSFKYGAEKYGFTPWELRVRFDWLNTGDFDHAQSVLSDRVVACSYERGKSSITRGFTRGQATVELWNDDSLLTPYNDGGALYSYLKPFREVEIALVSGSVVQKRFRGWTERYVPRTTIGGRRTCVVYLVDVLRLMELTAFSLAMKENAFVAAETLSYSAPSPAASGVVGDPPPADPSDLINLVLNAVRSVKPKANTWFTFDVQGSWNGFDIAPLFAEHLQFAARTIDDIQDVIPYAWWDNTTVRDALNDLMTVSGASYHVAGDGRIIVHSRYHNFTVPASEDSQETIGADVAEVEQEISDVDLVNVARVTVQGYTEQGSASTLWQLGNPPITIQPGEQVEIVVNYSGPAVDVITPVATTDYTATKDYAGAGEDVTADLDVDFTSYGESAQLLLTNTLAVPMFVQTFKVRGTLLDADDAIVEEGLDDLSVAQYFKRKRDLSNFLIQERSRGSSIASQQVLVKAQPKTTPLLTLHNSYPAQIGRKIGDRITVELEDGMAAKDYHIVGIRETIKPFADEGVDLETRWFLEEPLDQVAGLSFFRFDEGPGFDVSVVCY